MAHVIELTDKLTRTDGRVADACRHIPGILILGAHVTSGSRTREVDAILLTPSALLTIEAKGTPMTGAVTPDVNAPWTIDGQPARFAGGPNPYRQTRTSAQMLRAHLKAADVPAPYIPAVTAVSGDGIDLSPTRLGDTWATAVEHLAATLLSLRPTPIPRAQARAILAALGCDVDDRTLELAGFPEAVTPAEEPTGTESAGGSRARRRERRFNDLQAKATREWRRSHDRRLLGSLFAVGVMAATCRDLPTVSYLEGALLMVAAAAAQVAMRHRSSGPRDSGRISTALWLFTLLPVFGIGACLSTLMHVPTVEAPAQGPLAILLVLTSLLLGCTMLSGKSAYVHPPAMVLERHDVNGNPTGAFMLASAQPRGMAGISWRAPDED